MWNMWKNFLKLGQYKENVFLDDYDWFENKDYNAHKTFTILNIDRFKTIFIRPAPFALISRFFYEDCPILFPFLPISRSLVRMTALVVDMRGTFPTQEKIRVLFQITAYYTI